MDKSFNIERPKVDLEAYKRQKREEFQSFFPGMKLEQMSNKEFNSVFKNNIYKSKNPKK